MNDEHSSNQRSDRKHGDDETDRYEWNGTVEPGVRVVQAVAAATGREPTALPALQEAVDVDAMNDILSGSSDGHRAVVSFEYANRVVEVDTGGTISIEP